METCTICDQEITFDADMDVWRNIFGYATVGYPYIFHYHYPLQISRATGNCESCDESNLSHVREFPGGNYCADTARCIMRQRLADNDRAIRAIFERI